MASKKDTTEPKEPNTGHFNDDGGLDSSTSDCHSSENNGGDERDEIKEVRERSRKDNFNVNLWRFALMALLLGVGVAITWTTYNFLREEELHNFETAFEQFSRTVGDAAVKQQLDTRISFQAFATTVSAYVQSSNASWPFVSIPLFEAYAANVLLQAGTEVFSFFPIVDASEREAWNEFANTRYEAMIDQQHLLRYGNLDQLNREGYHPYISAPKPGGGGFVEDVSNSSYYFPSWHWSPPAVTYGLINWNLMTVPDYKAVTEAIFELKNESLVTRVRAYVGVPTSLSYEEHDLMHSKLTEGSEDLNPHSFVFTPIHETVGDTSSPIKAVMGTGMAWDFALLNLLPEGVVGLMTVIRNDCDQTYSYELNGPDAIYLGEGDKHDTKYDAYEKIVDLAVHTHPNFTTTPGHCQYKMYLYPGSEFELSYDSNVPLTYAIVVASTFLLVAVVFYIYNWFVNRRNEMLVVNAARSNAVITSLFPSIIRDRIIEENNHLATSRTKTSKNFKDALMGHADGPSDMSRPPLADYFPESTVLFADISGFTAWSSVREPSQVFTLLETIYGAFDRLTKVSKVFKVETIGDCYVAATGIPEAQNDHAASMVRFAHNILREMAKLTKRLELSLGPDTGDLSLRVGIHSGPITAGVLRGERARFQLFGDTMNTASRIENTGTAGRIHISKETAELLTKSGKGAWVTKRKETVTAKGKGDIQTYWIMSSLDKKAAGIRSSDSENSGDDVLRNPSGNDLDARESRLVDWNVQMLLEYLKQIVTRRNARDEAAFIRGRDRQSARDRSKSIDGNPFGEFLNDKSFIPLEEVNEIIQLPEFDSKASKLQHDPRYTIIADNVVEQLRDYVMCVAGMYRANQFHNFEHASHVTMSVIKLLSRIVAPTDLDTMTEDDNEENSEKRQMTSIEAKLHDHTYGITSDPLTQFACAFSALIHDVDHEGVPNAQLVKEHTKSANVYNNRSVAEQNSMVLAWNLLMETRFSDLRNCLCATTSELRRLRNLTVNGVMATDITDKDLKTLRNARWDRAFKSDAPEENIRDGVNRKATIVMEHLIQASDVAHTMQHWHVYRKWNERFFRECYAAYRAGRAEKDPIDGWYEGEIGFFDFYIIPLAKKLEDCGVFGKSSDEYLSYARANRDEWKARGQQVVAEMTEAVQKEYAAKDLKQSTQDTPLFSSNRIEGTISKLGHEI